jgi:deoxycytidine triphosphate deaminase
MKPQPSVAILSDVDIQAALAGGKLGITPFASDHLQSASYDLSIGEVLGRAGRKKKDSKGVERRVHELAPGEATFILTKESLNLDEEVAGSISLMNRRAHQGLDLVNPGHVDPGWGCDTNGKVVGRQLTAVMRNISSDTIELWEGDMFLTIVFEMLQSKTSNPYRPTSDDTDERRKDLLEKAKKIESFVDTQKEIQKELGEKLSYRELMNSLVLLVAAIGLILTVLVGFVSTANSRAATFVLAGFKISAPILMFLFAMVIFAVILISMFLGRERSGKSHSR